MGRKQAKLVLPPGDRNGSVDRATALATDFAQHARTVFERLNAVMLQLVESVPGSIRRAVDLQNALDVTAPLAWRIFKIAGADDPFEIVDYIPGPGELEMLLEAVRKKKISTDVVNNVRLAMNGYAELVREHTGSRQSLRTMLTSLRSDKPQGIDEQVRRAAFQSNGLVWGYQVDVSINCFIDDLPLESGLVKTVLVKGGVGLHRVRLDGTNKMKINVGDFPDVPDIDATLNMEVCREFCSSGVDIRLQQEDDDRYPFCATINLPELGRRAAANYYFDLSSVEQHNPGSRLELINTVPCAMLHSDILVPASTERRMGRAEVYKHPLISGLREGSELRPSDLMPVDAAIVYLGKMTDVPTVPGAPRYSELIQRVLKFHGYYGMQFDVYRCRLAYPLLPSIVRLSVPSASEGS